MKTTAAGSVTAEVRNGNSNGNGTSWLTDRTKDAEKLKVNGNGTGPGRKEGRSNDNGFEQWGGYMPAKKAKLDAQFHSAERNGGLSETGPGIFNGISVYINGYTNPPEPELRQMFIKHGGAFHPYNSTKTTFVIATNLSAPSKNLYAVKTIKPEWITESIAAGVKLDSRKYMLYDLNRESKQHTLTQMMAPKQPNGTVVENGHSEKSPDEESNSISNGHANLSNGLSHDSVEINGKTDDDVTDIDNDSDFLPASDEESKDKGAIKQPKDLSSKLNGLNGFKSVNPEILDKFVPSNAAQQSRKRVKMATEEGFLEDFFNNSRLHLISDQKKEMQNKIGNMRKSVTSHNFELFSLFREELKMENKNYFNGDEGNDFVNEVPVTLMHVDLDCFFVSVGLQSRPHLRGQPVVVTNSSGNYTDSKADIASASYEARKFGVRNGMWVSEAKKLCSELQVVPYDFDEYRRVSEVFFETVAKITLDIEPSSVDEMVVDATSVLQKVPGSTPMNLAEFIRRKIYEAVKCPASIGIGENRLLAKLATKKAKPDGVYHLLTEEAVGYISELEVRELPGIGWSHEAKLMELFNVKLCKELLEVPVQDLKNEFGNKTAEKMRQFCNGIDTAELKFGFDRPKSISVDVNYGIRFTKDEEVSEFMLQLSKELCSRAVRAQAKGMGVCLKILARKKGAGEPKKHGGHGIVDSITKSNRFFQATNDWNEVYRTVMKLLRLVVLPPTDYRGIGLSLSDLSFEFDKSQTQKKSLQKTLFDLTTSRGRKMLEFARKATGIQTNSKSSTSTSGHLNSTKPLNLKTNEMEEPAEPLVPKAKKRKIDATVTANVPDPGWNDDGWNVKPNENGTTDTNGTGQIDINVLRELPPDIAREMAQHYGIDVAQLQLSPERKLRTKSFDTFRSPRPLRPAQKGKTKDDREVLGDITESVTSTSTSASDTIESVIQQSKATAVSTGVIVDPYGEIDKIDPAFLSALPDSIRNEVLLQFQEAKGRKGEETGPTENGEIREPQPCSSKQAIARDAALKLIANKKPIQSAAPRYVAPLEEDYIQMQNQLAKANLECNEQMCDEELICVTPPPSASPSPIRFTNSSSRRRYFSRTKLTPLSSKRKLDFSKCVDSKGNANDAQPNANRFKNIKWKAFWRKPSYKAPIVQPANPDAIVALPALNGAVEIEDVRNQIREGIDCVTDPLPEDVQVLHKYFGELVSRGYLRQTSVLLKFISRRYDQLPEESPWRKILENLIFTSQEQCSSLYTHALQLE